MPRISAILAIFLNLSLALSSRAQDTSPASEILKTWEKTSISNATVHYEDISRTFAEFGEDPFSGSQKDSKLITVSNAIFRRAKGLGMKAQYNNDAQSTCNFLNGVGASSRKSHPNFYEIDIKPQGQTHMEATILTEAMLTWLDPSLTSAGKALTAKNKEKLDVTSAEKGNRIAKFSANGITYRLAEKEDWRVVEISIDKQKGVPPEWTFEYDLAADQKLVLKRAVRTANNPHEQLGWVPSHSSEFAVTDANFGELTEADIAIKFPTPAIIHDNTGPSKMDFILQADGSKTPFSKAEYQKLLNASTAKKKNVKKE